MITLIVTFALVLLHASPLLDSTDWPKQLNLESSTMVTSINESSRFYWIGTTQGLYRVNKCNLKYWLLNTENSRLPHDHVTSIAIDPEGRTYIGTPEGILYFDNYGFMLINTENSPLPENYITSLNFGQDGALWIATRNYGLFKGVGRDVKAFKLIPFQLP